VLFSTLMLFAQQKGPQGGDAAAGMAVMIFSCICYALIFAFAIGFMIFHLMTCYKALSAVSPGNRDMEPAMIFLVFIPLFGAIWNFFIVLRLASSLRKEFEDRGIPSDGGDYGQTIGLWGLILNLIGCAPVGIIMFIMWLFKIRGYTAQLTEGRRGSVDD
jgi:hypothetical protein